MTSPARRKLLVTTGDPAGVGPEVIAAALASGDMPPDFEIEVIGDRHHATPGRPDLDSARAALEALEEAGSRWASDPLVAGVITGPVAKAGLVAAGYQFPGQTEFFARASGTENYAMCLTGKTLTVGLATIHIPLREVPSRLSSAEIVRTGLLLGRFLKQRLGRIARVAVAGLNPHAGEQGKFGDEEERLIAPALDELRKYPDMAEFMGPAVPDAIFREALAGTCDAVLAMYHDQGLIPLKLVDFDSAVNVTLGLPKPRTSPGHGTAFDIAGTGRASPAPMIHAIQLAAELARKS